MRLMVFVTGCLRVLRKLWMSAFVPMQARPDPLIGTRMLGSMVQRAGVIAATAPLSLLMISHGTPTERLWTCCSMIRAHSVSAASQAGRSLGPDNRMVTRPMMYRLSVPS